MKDITILDRIIRFVIGAVVVGAPVAFIFSFHWLLACSIAVLCGFLAAVLGDRFFNWIADSALWQFVRGFFQLKGR